MGEYIGYNPANYTPENFMRPKTAVVWSELSYLNDQMRHLIEGTMRVDRGSLLVGSEFEVFLFDGNSDPNETWQKYDDGRRNPNYQKAHKNKVQKIARLASDLDSRESSRFLECTRESALLLEMRTTPQNVEGYVDTVSYLADWLRHQARENEVMPVVHSQHIHISSNRRGFPSLDPRRRYDRYLLSQDFDEEVVNAAFSRVLPLMLLPEEYDGDDSVPSASATKGSDIKTMHPEFRLLSSEYMNDPILNLNVSLRAMYASMYNPAMVTDMDLFETHQEAVEYMRQDQELAAFFGQGTLTTLSNIAGQYPAVSRRDITIDEVWT